MRCSGTGLVWIILAGTVCAAQPDRSRQEILAAEIGEKAVELVPITEGQIRDAQANVMEAARRLEQFLAGGSSANAEAWKRYLGWQELQQLIATRSPDPAAVTSAAMPLFSGQPGLELPAFLELREALVAYNRLLSAQAEPEMQQRLTEQLIALREALQKAGDDPAAATAEIAARLDWLEQLGQAAELVTRVRQSFDHPNL